MCIVSLARAAIERARSWLELVTYAAGEPHHSARSRRSGSRPSCGFVDLVETPEQRRGAAESVAAVGSRLYILRHDIPHAEQYGRILAIPSKRASSRAISYLSMRMRAR